ncbi:MULTISPECIES: shikimate dehydrogenase [unclassified Mucilaginibacter]|uniref:shikimate dehydrogenase family protein n=1 Tax=unclassified Mucilaginibacter TaxID=2617802 RepID=UPI002AC8BBEE|nr:MULTISPECIES: shikimate dehydrogenase [unclassified Mucilaginibacter]MEB0263777.1 shikimate dehydrogenase [Mucilaginibacter sp. 10I4]MEB0280238.1 shikimate dehydrogenase [Mucilaginibacter sp. 10B2]MEB0301139.1 shikimate dehydrogenase [Mucilaginibacter sp. 5C4]WPX24353.1 shikimate dehydrogenase [Mucilaginibacter sp. 5C4]
MKHYGLIGFPLTHSFSKKYFTEKFETEKIEDCTYELYPLENIDDLPKLLHENPTLCGLNVTIPHKVNVLQYLDWIEHDAKGAGAVNCIRITSESPLQAAFSGEVGVKGHDFRLEGYNTDIYGFEMSLSPLLTDKHETALILGDGGAARAVKCVLDNKDIPYKCVTRKTAEGNILFNDLTVKDIADNKLIINTTPIGTHPNVDECPPIPYEGVTEDHLLFDLIYNPEQTLFLKKGAEQGAATKNGYEMLVLQAEKAWEIWNSKQKHP